MFLDLLLIKINVGSILSDISMKNMSFPLKTLQSNDAPEG